MTGLSENARIVREDIVDFNANHIHSYVDVTNQNIPYQLHKCLVVHGGATCPAPYRWRWNDLFDWTYCKENPQG